MSEALRAIRQEFWAHVIAQDPALRTYMDSNAWCPVSPDKRVILAFGIEQTGSSVFLRGQLNTLPDTAGPLLTPHAQTLSKLLSASFIADGDAGQGRYLRKRNKAAFTLRRQWPDIARWFTACRLRYTDVLAQTLGDTA
jgi:hypothetical protein